MSEIFVENKKLFEIIYEMEKVSASFDVLGCGLDSSMSEEELDRYETAEILLRTNILRLKKLAGYPVAVG